MNDTRDSRTDGEIYLRYNRHERLKRASESVQQMHQPDYIKRSSLIKSLTTMRSSRSSLFAILIVVAISLGSLFLRSTDRQAGKIRGVPAKLEYLRQQDTLYVNVSLNATAQDEDDALPVTVQITAANRETEQQETKTVKAIYIGSALSLPAQFPARAFNRIEASIFAGEKTLTLRAALKE